MKPTASIIFFTVSSGVGLGLLALIVLADVLGFGHLPDAALWRGALLGLALVAAGLASSVLHLANPKKAWRWFAGVRTSCVRAEAAFAWVLFPVAGLYIALVARDGGGASRVLLALLSCALA